ncbi:hypothetical protein HII31_00871 [Pseudocercospora fuligena]|uniref:BZIP domain-containing protein n=1 Tax=Pseudocercospora fuligena TaxID=685502 RepID=A0A8H6RVQ7_9PEZI|nr:hypothetical protein HII31_00871 [Pseudocercospora fuligena]
METATQKRNTERRKRRSRTSNSPEENSGDDGKKRGRPRVEKQDESAADRRRTQIRMAQRAYRQRKESTLEEFRKRVSDLQNTIELMNKAFLDCRNRLAIAGLPEAQLRDVEEVALQYESFMKFTRNPDASSPSELGERARQGPIASTHGSDSVHVSAEPKNVPSWIDQQALSYTPRQVELSDMGMGYTMELQDGDAMDVSADYFPTFSQSQNQLALVSSQKHTGRDFDAFEHDIPVELELPRTYSFQESTFGRRLHRASLEGGYQLLLDPGRSPKTFDRVFRLSLMSRDRSKLTAAMKEALSRGPHEPLNQGAPLIHIGGAGTHFPRRDRYGNAEPKKPSWNLGVVGPQTLALLENAAKDNLTTDMTVDIAGFEGEWFDPYDVEGYLEEKGIIIDPGSSFAEADVLVWPSTSSNASTLSTAQASSPKTPQQYSFANLVDTIDKGLTTIDSGLVNTIDKGLNAVDSRGSPSIWNLDDLGVTSLSDVGYSDATTGSWMNFVQPGQSTRRHLSSEPQAQDRLQSSAQQPETDHWEGSHTTEFLLEPDNRGRLTMFTGGLGKNGSSGPLHKRSIIIDVAKFVKVMTLSGVCLGRTPGFKRRDVDRALALASFDAF